MAKRKKQTKFGIVERENMAQIKHDDKAWTCNLHSVNSRYGPQSRIYCKRIKKEQLKGCLEGEGMRMTSFYPPGKALATPDSYYLDFCCYAGEGRPTRCFSGQIPKEDMFMLFASYLREEKPS